MPSRASASRASSPAAASFGAATTVTSSPDFKAFARYGLVANHRDQTTVQLDDALARVCTRYGPLIVGLVLIALIIVFVSWAPARPFSF